MSILIVVVLPAPFGPEQPEQLAALDLEVDATDRLDLLGGAFEHAGPGAVGAPKTWRPR